MRPSFSRAICSKWQPGNGSRGEWRLNVKSYGDFSAAILPEMTLQMIVGNDVFQRSTTWTKLKTGWKANLN
jgi:hypothetical protein